jgi:uncharacterized membrane protein
VEEKPVAAGVGETRKAMVLLESRSDRKVDGHVTLQLPAGWSVEKDGLQRGIWLTFSGERKGVTYKIVVPPGAAPGEYPIRVDAKIGDRSYTTGGIVTVAPPVTRSADNK